MKNIVKKMDLNLETHLFILKMLRRLETSLILLFNAPDDESKAKIIKALDDYFKDFSDLCGYLHLKYCEKGRKQK